MRRIFRFREIGQISFSDFVSRFSTRIEDNVVVSINSILNNVAPLSTYLIWNLKSVKQHNNLEPNFGLAIYFYPKLECKGSEDENICRWSGRLLLRFRPYLANRRDDPAAEIRSDKRQRLRGLGCTPPRAQEERNQTKVNLHSYLVVIHWIGDLCRKANKNNSFATNLW